MSGHAALTRARREAIWLQRRSNEGDALHEIERSQQEVIFCLRTCGQQLVVAAASKGVAGAVVISCALSTSRISPTGKSSGVFFETIGTVVPPGTPSVTAKGLPNCPSRPIENALPSDSVVLRRKCCTHFLFNLHKQSAHLPTGTIRVGQHQQRQRMNRHHRSQLLDLAYRRVLQASFEATDVRTARHNIEGLLR
jgi:hypothetical protein